MKGLGGPVNSTKDKNSRGGGDGKVELDELVPYVRCIVGDLTSNAQHVQEAGRIPGHVVLSAGKGAGNW